MRIGIEIKRACLALTVFSVTLTFLIISVAARPNHSDDSAAVYKAKCAMCHGATADKKFDATKPDAELTMIVLKGKKAEKPPNMPGYEDKGMSSDQAAALISFMKAQRQ